MAERILVVDDEEDITLTLSLILAREGYETSTASSLDEALARVRGERFDVVLVDLMLADEDGLQVLAGLRQHSPDTVAIVLSGYGSLASARRAIHLGVVEYLTKPVQIDELKDALAQGLAKRRAILAARRAVADERERLLAAERAARADAEAAQRHLRDLFLAAPAFVAVTRGPNHSLELINDPFAELVGLTGPEAVIGRSLRDAFPQLVQAGYVALADWVYRSGAPYIAREMPGLLDHDHDGVVEKRWTNVVIKPYRDGHGKIGGLLFHGFDVTEQVLARRREEEARRQVAAERAFLETVIQQMPAAVAIFEAPSFRVLLANDQLFQVAGMTSLTAGNILDHSFLRGLDATGRRSHDEERPLIRAVRGGETIVGEEEEFIRGDGARVTFQVSAAPVRDQSDQIVAGVLSMVDVSQRKRGERRHAVLADLSRDLAAARLDRFEALSIVCRAAVNAVGEHASIHLVDQDGSTLRVAALHDPDEARRCDRQRILGDHPLRVGEGWTGRVVATNAPLFLPVVDLDSLRNRTMPEHRICMERLFAKGMIVVPMQANGRVHGALTLGRGAAGPRYSNDDLTLLQEIADRAAVTLENTYLYEAAQVSRARAEEAAQRTAHLQTVAVKLAGAITVDDVAEVLVDQALAALGARAGAVALLSSDGCTVDVIRAIGYSSEAIASYQHVAIDAKFPLAECIRSGESLFLPSGRERGARYPHLADLRRQSGEGALAAVPLVLNGRVVGAVGINFPEPRDFSSEERELLLSIARQCAQAFERARLYDAERQARAEAEAATNLRDEFLTIAAHELKTPLTSLRASAQLVLRALVKGDVVDPDALKRRLATVESQSVKLAALVNQLLDVTRLESGRLLIDPVDVDLQDIVRAVASIAQSRTEMHSILVKGEASIATVDPLRIEQVVTNLLDNAIKYSPNGGVIQVEVSAMPPDHVLVSVTDEGIGVPAEHREHIFDCFSQAHTSSHLSGLGLGLYISRQIVELHGGTIRAAFPSAGGTRLEVTLPVRRSPPVSTTPLS